MTLLNDGTLRINTVQENDAGTYVCRVESVAGNATTSGTLSVQGAYLYTACSALPFLRVLNRRRHPAIDRRLLWDL